MKQRIVINLYPVASGGGLQNALSFLKMLSEYTNKDDYVCFLRTGSELEIYCLKQSISHYSFMDGKVGRVLFELVTAKLICKKIQPLVVFTIFGNCPFNNVNSTRVSGFARSDIVEKSSHYWSHLSVFKKIGMRIKDTLILFVVKRSDVVILETDRLAKLAIKSGAFGKAKIRVVKMAVSSVVRDALNDLPEINVNKIRDRHKILYLSGATPNKNIHRLAPIIKALNQESGKNGASYILQSTLPKGAYLDRVENSFNEIGCLGLFENLGRVEQSEISTVIASASAMINVAEIESFSNNWVEAWSARRLLICRDAQYARDSCLDGALYIKLEDPKRAANQILKVLTSHEDLAIFIENGKRIINALPTSEDKFRQYLEIINDNKTLNHQNKSKIN